MYKSSTKDLQPGRGVALPLPFAALNLPAAVSGAGMLAGAGKVTTEWLSFVYRRLGADARLLGQLATATSPAKFWSHCAEFQEQAVQDYWQEYAALTRLASDNVRAGLGLGGERRPAEAAETTREAAAVARAA
jgi:hypothetical protein